ncbi:TPA: histidine kinase, partial [Streptococcus suis]
RDRGFVTNAFTVAFEELYMEFIQRPLESYVQLVKFGNSEIDEIGIDDQHAVEKLTNRFKKYNFTVEPQFYELPKVAQPLERKIQLLNDKNLSSTEKQEIQKSVEHSAKALTRENREVKKEKKQVEKENARLKNEVEIKEKIIDDSKPARQDMLFHELGKVSRELNGTLRKMIRLMDEDEQEKFSDSIYKIRR